MKKTGFFIGISIFLLVLSLPLPGADKAVQNCLALSLLAVTWWTFTVCHPGYVAVLLLVGYVVSDTAPVDVVFSLWITPLVYLVIGGYLLASAVKSSGLGRRIAYIYILRYVHSYQSIIIGAYVLGFLLSFLIPHPWPRCFLIMPVMATIIGSSKLSAPDGANIGLAVFAGSAPTSMILLTGDSSLNIVAVGFSGQELSWIGWLWQMGLPGCAASVLTLLVQLHLYRPRHEIEINKTDIRIKLDQMGPTSRSEKTCLAWLLLAITFWATGSLHTIHPGWIALLAAAGLSLPVIGGVLKPNAWNDVPIANLLFLTAALAIGKVGAHSGMNKWLADVLLPPGVPNNPYLYAAMVTAMVIMVHMCLGSVLAVMGIVTPVLIQFGSGLGINPLVPALMVYTAASIHYILPIHHMNLLIGLGPEQGRYTVRHVVHLGLPLTIIVFVVTIGVEIVWWKITGLL